METSRWCHGGDGFPRNSDRYERFTVVASVTRVIIEVSNVNKTKAGVESGEVTGHPRPRSVRHTPSVVCSR